MVKSEEILYGEGFEEYNRSPTDPIVSPDILNSVFDDIPLIMILVNQGGKVENINRTATIALGKEKKDALGLLRGELFGCVNSIKGEGCGKNRECSECTIRNSVMHTFETGESIYKKESELEIVNNDQSVTFDFLISTTLLQHNNEPIVLLTADNITEQKLFEKIIKESEMKYKELADSLPQTIFETDLQGNLMFVNNRAFGMFGYAQEDFDKGFNLFRALIPEDLDRARLNFEEAIRRENRTPSEYTALRKDGSAFPIAIYASRIVHDGKPMGIRGILIDITERKIAEKALRHSEEKYSNLVENGNDGIVIIQDFVLKYANKKMVDLCGYSIEEVIGKPFIDFVSPEYVDLVKQRYTKRLSGVNISNNYEIEVISKNGKKIPVDINASTIEYEGRPADVAIVRDVTERKQIENALQRSNEKYHRFAETINDLIFRADPETLVATYVNPAVERIYGYTVEEWLSDPKLWAQTIYPDDRDRVLAKATELQKTLGDAVLEYRIIKKDKTIRWVKVDLAWEKDQQGKPISMIGVMYDITESKDAQEAMLNAKIAAEDANRTKSEFIMNMSHEIRTPLNVVIGFSHVLLENSGNLDEKQMHYMKHILINSKHLLEMFNEVIDISKIEHGEIDFHPTIVSILDIISEIETLVNPLALERDITVTPNIDHEKIILKADKTKLKQILYNLVHNAIKFTPNGGNVIIETNKCGELMHFFVKDTGVGISPADHNKLFEQFSQVDSSTTRKYGGIGMGLNIVKRFVEMHGGEVWVESEFGKGSTFGFSIPTDPENASI
ncbi:PAS domain-containing sensor histidine kinase [Methanococcoides sp. AM1]|uniref:PAS domain-containing sensor histidine kinase n=1 Tax=Methanococcoides sp. AM1 TaxID=1201011 RepID=UPI0014383762|nr:PAS domain-containing sensor histidine kinase [Methanococcoides sp. AM1]